LAGGRRWVAIVIMTVVMLLIFIVPISLAIGTLFDATAQGVELVRTYFTQGLGEPPTWVSKLPWVGSKVATKWHEIAAGGPEALTQIAQPYVHVAASWVLGVSGGPGRVIVPFLHHHHCAILYTSGESATKC
jgi:predicted PurR-regulated permease PerM